MMAGDDYLTTRQIANLCGVSTTTVIRWIDTGKLKGFKLPSGHRRAVYGDVSEFLKRFGIPLPDEVSDETKKLNGDSRNGEAGAYQVHKYEG